MNIDNDIQSNDLTQLSSREQLSALMDGALPEDQTRFLLRRLQHDADLAGSWERWRIAGEALRGHLPARRLPPDFSARVAAALQADPAPTAAPGAPRWRRWGGGAALAAALAVVALLVRPGLDPAVVPQATPALAAAANVQPAAMPSGSPQPAQPAPAPEPLHEAPQLAMAVAAAAVSKPLRRERAGRAAVRVATQPERIAAAEPAHPIAVLPALPEAAATARPWPRSVLSQYAGDGLTVGFGDHLPRPAERNPFLPSVFDVPPRLRSDPGLPAPPASAPASGEAAALQP